MRSSRSPLMRSADCSSWPLSHATASAGSWPSPLACARARCLASSGPTSTSTRSDRLSARVLAQVAPMAAPGTAAVRRRGQLPARVRINPETGTTKSRAGNRQVAAYHRSSPPFFAPFARPTRRARPRRQRHGMRVGGSSPPRRAPHQPPHRLVHLEGPAPAGRHRDGRLHDASHTAATVLLMLGVSQTHDDEHHGLVQPRHGPALRPRCRTDPGDVARRVDELLLAGPRDTGGPE